VLLLTKKISKKFSSPRYIEQNEEEVTLLCNTRYIELEIVLFGIILGPFWDHFGTNLGPILDFFENKLGNYSATACRLCFQYGIGEPLIGTVSANQQGQMARPEIV
jgi:hypothetical protein